MFCFVFNIFVSFCLFLKIIKYYRLWFLLCYFVPHSEIYIKKPIKAISYILKGTLGHLCCFGKNKTYMINSKLIRFFVNWFVIDMFFFFQRVIYMGLMVDDLVWFELMEDSLRIYYKSLHNVRDICGNKTAGFAYALRSIPCFGEFLTDST